LSYCPRSSLPAHVLDWLAARLAHLLPPRPPGQGGTPPLSLEVRLDAVGAVILDGLSYRRAGRAVGISKTEVGDSLDLLLGPLAALGYCQPDGSFITSLDELRHWLGEMAEVGEAVCLDGLATRVQRPCGWANQKVVYNALRRWWEQVGSLAYPKADRLLITADAGGSNGYRVRAWKTELARLAAETGLQITVCHLPPGTSKWNRIEHRLFSAISMNWRGRPLASHDVIVELIGATTTHTGLRVRAELDRGRYPLGVKVRDQELAAVPLTWHEFHGEWNYTIQPAA